MKYFMSSYAADNFDFFAKLPVTQLCARDGSG